jgi:preprotein translocase SecE subunit
VSTELARPNAARRVVGFLRDVVGEMEKVTWPDRGQVRQLSLVVVGFSLLVGLIILVMDLAIQGVLLKLVPAVLGRG